MKQVIMVSIVAILGLAFLFVMQWNTTGMLPYKMTACTRAAVDPTLGYTNCMSQARQVCAEAHIPYMSDTSKYNSCYNWCVRDAQALCNI